MKDFKSISNLPIFQCKPNLKQAERKKVTKIGTEIIKCRTKKQ